MLFTLDDIDTLRATYAAAADYAAFFFAMRERSALRCMLPYMPL